MLSSRDKAAVYAALATSRARLNDLTTGVHDGCLATSQDQIWDLDWFRANARVAKAAATMVEKLSQDFGYDQMIDEAKKAAEEAELYTEVAEFENRIRTQ